MTQTLGTEEKILVGERVPTVTELVSRQMDRYKRKAELHEHVARTNHDEHDEHVRLAAECDRLVRQLDELWDKLNKGEVSVE
ncbi:MAG: hypothetical protein ABEL51_15695 [Salinibacter sp.]